MDAAAQYAVAVAARTLCLIFQGHSNRKRALQVVTLSLLTEWIPLLLSGAK
jgi:hypothetical protein